MGTSIVNLTPAQLQALLDGPAGKPPLGITPNFVNPPNHATLAIAVMAIGLTISTLVLMIRMYTKIFLIRSVVLEDYAVVIAWVGSVAYSALSGITLRCGSGTNIWNVQLKTYFRLFYWINLISIIYGPVIFLIKLSILLQYLHILRPTRQGNMFLYVGVQTWIVLIFMFYFINTMFDIFQCIPRERIWNPLLTTGHCINANAGVKASGIFNVVSDFMIFSLPIPSIWKLKIPLKKKLSIIAIFSAGFVACIASVLRTTYSLRLSQTPDFTHEVNLVGLWALVEIYIGYIVSCLPQSPRFFQFIGPKVSNSFTRIASFGNRMTGLTSQSNHRRASSTSGQPLANHTASNVRNDSYEVGTKRREEYITLEERGPKSTEKTTVTDTLSSLYDEYFGRHDDVERGAGGILVERVTQVESVLPPPRIHSWGGEKANGGRYPLWP